MPTFIIEERVPCTHVWTYAIIAATEEEAMDLIHSGKAEASDSSHEDYNYDETEWNVEEAENDEDDDDDKGDDDRWMIRSEIRSWDKKEGE